MLIIILKLVFSNLSLTPLFFIFAKWTSVENNDDLGKDINGCLKTIYKRKQHLIINEVFK